MLQKLSTKLLSRILSHPSLPTETWYLVTTQTLSSLNAPHLIPQVLSHTFSNGIGGRSTAPVLHEADQLRVVRRMREGLVKGAVINGLPKSINALLELKKATPAQLLDEPSSTSPTARHDEIYNSSPASVLSRGQAFFDQVYGKVSKRVMSQMMYSGTEDLGLVARLLYGYVLSNTSVLSARDTSFCVIAGLIPQDVNPQLKGHLKGAINNGASVEQVNAVREVVLWICEEVGEARRAGWKEDAAKL